MVGAASESALIEATPSYWRSYPARRSLPGSTVPKTPSPTSRSRQRCRSRLSGAGFSRSCLAFRHAGDDRSTGASVTWAIKNSQGIEAGGIETATATSNQSDFGISCGCHPLVPAANWQLRRPPPAAVAVRAKPAAFLTTYAHFSGCRKLISVDAGRKKAGWP
jgi:hypothetical protein